MTLETEETQPNWLEQEVKELSNQSNIEKHEPMKFEENSIMDVELDFSKPFQKWHDKNAKGVEVTKYIIPVKHAGQIKNWWLNVKNPITREILAAGLKGQTKFKILQTGNQANTKYVLVK